MIDGPTPDGGVSSHWHPAIRVVEDTVTSLKFWLVIAAWRIVLARYGLWAIATGKRVRHAAAGRAKTSRFYGAMHYGARIGNHGASDLIAYLRRERQEAAFATYGVVA